MDGKSMSKRVKPLAYGPDGYSYECKACLARKIVEDSVGEFDRNFRHVMRDVEALIKQSGKPVAVKVRKYAGMQIRRERMLGAINGLLSAFYDVWAALEDRADHESAKVAEFTDARRRGAKGKQKNDPVQAAKAVAAGLWPEARRRGWTAERMHHELERQGHVAKPDTVRKWMTKLRKTGTC